MTNCPCCTGRPYSACCEPVIKSALAPSALKLMRSRFTAYHNGQAEYLLETTHQKTRLHHQLNDIAQWSEENTWTKLEIMGVEHGNKNDQRGTVEFKAYYQDKNDKEQVHHEKSTFLKEGVQWFYLDGIINPKQKVELKRISRNDPCPCGSGKKHKKCCL